MNKPPRITRTQIVECNYSWSAVNQALAYRRCLNFLKITGGKADAEIPIKSMMRYHALEAIRLVRCYTPACYYPQNPTYHETHLH
jgi:hypothetical protein